MNVSLCTANTWISAGWYRLLVGIYIVIVIGWFAGIVSASRGAIYAFAHKAESKIIEAAQGVFFTTPQEVRLQHHALPAVSSINQLFKQYAFNSITSIACSYKNMEV